MARFAEPMSRLIDELRKLPGIGTKNAQRLAFHVLRSSDADAQALAEAILVLREKLRLCSVCNNITDVDPCVYCTSAVRDPQVVCVVEEPTNIATIEKTRSYNGVYHVLHGTLSPIGGRGAGAAADCEPADAAGCAWRSGRLGEGDSATAPSVPKASSGCRFAR